MKDSLVVATAALAACASTAARQKGPLDQCSFYGSREAGQRLWKMLSLGASKPWPDALETMTGQRQMDGSALLEYFQPLQGWLKQQNQGKQCGC